MINYFDSLNLTLSTHIIYNPRFKKRNFKRLITPQGEGINIFRGKWKYF